MKTMKTKKAATYSLSRDLITAIETKVDIKSEHSRSRSMVAERLIRSGLQAEKGTKV